MARKNGVVQSSTTIQQVLQMKAIVNSVHVENTAGIRSSFIHAAPFKHVLLENFLEPGFLNAIRAEFPVPPMPTELKNEFGRTNRKHAVHEIRDLGHSFRAWDELLKSEGFIHWLSAVTGIEGLIYDPEYYGAGTHNNQHGQSMDVHIDFNYHRTTGYHRRLNLIVYISEEWERSWGGDLELHKDPWKPESDQWISYPSFGNNAVIFETNEISWHGFNEITLPENKRHLSRKSLTVYYYSKERPAEETGRKHMTIYVPRPISPSIKPGETLAENEFLALKKNLVKRNQFLAALYNREMDLLEIIDNQQHMLHLHAEAFRVPVLGYVAQVGKVSGLLPSFVVTDVMTVDMVPARPITSMTLEGYVPDFVDEGKNTIQINIDGQMALSALAEGRFSMTIPLEKAAGEKFQVCIEPKLFVSPLELGLNNDNTPFSFVFINLIFE